MDEKTEQIKSGWQLIPRKIIGGLFAMGLVAKAALDLKDAQQWQFGLTIICMTLLGAMAIWTHYLLEHGPKIKKDKKVLTTNPPN